MRKMGRFALLLVCLVHAINGLVVGEALILKLLNEAAAGEGHEGEVAFGGRNGLLIPVGTAVVGGVSGFLLGVALVFTGQ